jgi:hypothetical protein
MQMKIISFFCLALTLALAGCNLSNTKPTPISPNYPEQAAFRLNSVGFEVKKPTDASWQILLRDWDPKKVIAVVNQKPNKFRDELAASTTITNTFSASTVTPNMTPVPFSMHKIASEPSDTASTGIDMVVIPGFRHTEGPVSLHVDLHIQDGRGAFSLNQFLSLRPGQSVMVARALDENTLQLILITPDIISGK